MFEFFSALGIWCWMVVRGGWLIIPTEAANASSTQLITNKLSADPFRGGSNKIVLCETIRSNGEPDASNLRQKCKEAMDQIKDLKPWFGLGRPLDLCVRVIDLKPPRRPILIKYNRLQQNKNTPSWMLMDGHTAGQNPPDTLKIKARITVALGLEKSSDATSQKLITGNKAQEANDASS